MSFIACICNIFNVNNKVDYIIVVILLQILSNSQTAFGLRGFLHFYRDNKKVESCTNLLGSHVLLWNTYLRIDGTSNEIIPTSGKATLTEVSCKCQYLDTYSDCMKTRKCCHTVGW